VQGPKPNKKKVQGLITKNDESAGTNDIFKPKINLGTKV